MTNCPALHMVEFPSLLQNALLTVHDMSGSLTFRPTEGASVNENEISKA